MVVFWCIEVEFGCILEYFGCTRLYLIVFWLANAILETGLHKLWYPCIRDTSTWSKFGAHGEHGDVFLFSNLGAL